MNGCQTCGGFGMHHDPVAHGQVTENGEPCMCGTPFTCLADEHDFEVARTSTLDGYADRMTAAPTTRTADDAFERPPWCGTCDEWTRKVEVEIDGRDAMQNCTRCHPLAVAS